MSDALIQFYNDELAVWIRALAFHRQETQNIVGRIGAVLGRDTLISKSDEKEMNEFIDQFTVQQQEFDHLVNQVTAQKLKLEATSRPAGTSDDQQTNEKHDSLRSQMLKAERNFMRSKYTCSAFLPSTFS